MEVNLKDCPVIANNLIKRLKNKKIDLVEYLTECAYWYMEATFDKIQYQLLPAKPSEVRELEEMNHYKRERLSDSYFDEKWQIGVYYDKEYKIKYENIGNLRQLKKVYDYLPEGDTVNRGKIRVKIRDFQSRMEEI